MASDDTLRLTPTEAFQQVVMRQVALQLQDTPYVLKGGAALIFTRGLNRHSTDLDFDARQKLNIHKRILLGLKSAGVQVSRIKVVKDTDTVQRFKIHYQDPSTGRDVLFKIETSFRHPPEDQEIEVLNGIRTYNVRNIFEQKMNAALDRTEARDLYDLAHLLQNYGDQLSDLQIQRVDSFSENLDLLAVRYQESFETDDVLLKLIDAEETVLRLREAVDVQLDVRKVVSQESDASDVLQVYWDQIIVPGVSKMLDTFGEKQEDGSLFFASKEYTYTRDTSGEMTITPKDGRPPLSPSNMNQRDVNVMTAIFDKMQKTNQSVKAQETKPSAGKLTHSHG